jgi:subtilisin family serine protease
MKPLSSLLLLSSFALAACGAPATVATVPAPVSSSSAGVATPPPSDAPSGRAVAVTLAEAPRNWQLLDESVDGIPGIGAERAMRELLAGKTPKRTVLVAIIDNGIDTSHVDLRANLWTSPQGTHGWNFIGGKDGKDVEFDTFEVTREYARCHNMPAASGAPPITDKERCTKIDSDYNKQKTDIERGASTYQQVSSIYQQILPMLASAAKVSVDSLTPARVRAIAPLSPQITQARQVYLELASQGASPEMIMGELPSIEGQAKYSLDPSYNPRTIVGDNYTNVNERDYGNRDLQAKDPKHGTHVAGIIGAVRGNGVGIDGVAPAVKFMVIRAVPDGDERDKDIANAIRYAADNGAKIISMSFGKAYSPYKAAVDDAVKYADSKGVLMIHAAGNDGQDISKEKTFPTPEYLTGGRPQNWMEVGAVSWKGGDSLVATFSNYSQTLVDVFAPGVDILSTTPGNHYERLSGTSMAAPVVSGLAALIMDYYPNLTAADVRKIIVSSVTKLNDQRVIRPGGDGPGSFTTFGTLSVSGGIVNAYNAIRMADDVSNGKARP